MIMVSEENLASIRLQLSTPKVITVVTHYNPDGDAIGSSLALRSYLIAKGHTVHCVAPNNFPDYLSWMPGSEHILIANKHVNTAKRYITKTDILFVVDMNAPHRSGKILEESIANSKAYKVLIDHHPNPNLDCQFQFSSIQTTSACEMVFRFINECMLEKDLIDINSGSCIYTGIITDTGSLSYACNNPITYEILHYLISMGVDGEKIHRMVYDNYSTSRIRLLGIALNHMKIMEENETSYMFLSKQEMLDNHFMDGDTEGFVNYGLSLRCVKFTAFFIERDERIRISFRSKDKFDVNKFASTYFSGGGHKNASASYHYDTLENTIRYFEEVVRNHPELHSDPENSLEE